MVRFSFGDEEEEEETEIVGSIIGNKRRNSRIEGEIGKKLQKSEGNQDQELEEEKEEIEAGISEKSEESCGIENKDGMISVTIDPDVLECSICCEPLRPPLYQCQNGHVACSLCCTKLPQDKCPTCSQSINFSRCRALEKVIESIKSSCCYSRYGCSKTLPYVEILSHQETCFYTPCFCPVPSCTFSGFPEQLSKHFGAYHGGSAIEFEYGKQFKVFLKQDKPFIVLSETHGLLFLLLNDRFVERRGNALSVVCLSPRSPEYDFVYQLVVSTAKCSLWLEAYAKNVKKWAGVYPSVVFLMVPRDHRSSSREIVLDVCIQRGEQRHLSDCNLPVNL